MGMIFEVQGPSVRTATAKFPTPEEAVHEASSRIFTTPSSRQYALETLQKGKPATFSYGFSEVFIAVLDR